MTTITTTAATVKWQQAATNLRAWNVGVQLSFYKAFKLQVSS